MHFSTKGANAGHFTSQVLFGPKYTLILPFSKQVLNIKYEIYFIFFIFVCSVSYVCAVQELSLHILT